MALDLIRALRTPHSERWLVRESRRDVAALDIHYTADHHVHGTLVVLDESGLDDSEIPALLTRIDEVLLPEAKLDDRTLAFTVVRGRVHGAFESEPDGAPHA